MKQNISSMSMATEALLLSEKIMEDIELSSSPLKNIALKASRLARLLGQFEMQQILLYEVGGFPTNPGGVSSEVWDLARKAGRVYQEKVDEDIKELATLDSIEQLEYDLESAKDNIIASRDADVSVSSANPSQYVSLPFGNSIERKNLRKDINKKSKIVAKRRAYIYQYVSSIYYELKYSSVSNNIFERIRGKVDSKIGSVIPESVKKFSAIYENLQSQNSEDWSNAVHSCRRILQDTADALYPPQEDKTVEISGKSRVVKLGRDNYINRLVAYVEENSDSKRFEEIVGSHMRYLGERLDSIFQAAQKGSHDIIASQDEADRYVIYTYMVVGDILALKNEIEHRAEKV